ncbi:unnamed protein product [Brassicogethes aeneus]|uniref:Glycosyltransferase family 92 protein n=1 Tax=Brassicogethes aeneus TaxID=1431903 RepID=A0A9P0AY80_BRAAE|nr:unnamed protein product [Brassicogethes aeneus]
MKKYHQLLLLITSLISISLFLIYRHEYNRLHYVLEVFNFFGHPCNFTELQRSDNVLAQHDWGPIPVWQETETGYIYSAFITGKGEVRAIALQSDTKIVPRNCYFWFEEKKKPVVGKFKFSKVTNDEAAVLNSYFYNCNLVNIELVPYAISFSFKSKRENDMKKIMLTNTLDHSLTINTTICVTPSMYSKKRLFEFVSYHKLIGFDNFIFYHRDIPHRISKFMANVANRLDIKVSFLPFNYPKGDSPQIRLLVENECNLRTLGQTKYVVTLETNEYIVPRNALTITSFLRNVDEDSKRFSLPVQKFCIDNLDLKKPIALQSFDVSDDYNYNVVRYIYKNTKIDDVVTTNAIDKTLASIHKYVRCSLSPQKSHTDKTMMKFYTDFYRSTLVQLLIHDQI